MRVYDRGFAVFRFHHDGPNALILAEREREGSGSLFRSLFQSMDGRVKQRVRANGRGTTNQDTASTVPKKSPEHYCRLPVRRQCRNVVSTGWNPVRYLAKGLSVRNGF